MRTETPHSDGITGTATPRRFNSGDAGLAQNMAGRLNAQRRHGGREDHRLTVVARRPAFQRVEDPRIARRLRFLMRSAAQVRDIIASST
jgi:hypothetical protein